MHENDQNKLIAIHKMFSLRVTNHALLAWTILQAVH